MKIVQITIICLLMGSSNFGLAQSNDNKIIDTILDRYFEAVGGKEKAIQVKSFHSVANGNLNNKEVVLTRKLMLPNYSLSVMNLNGYTISKTLFNGSNAIWIQQDVEKKMSTDELKRLKQNRSIFPEFDYYNNAKYIGEATIDSVKVDILEINKAKVYFDKNTGLKIKATTIKTKENHTFEQHTYFSKYLEIEGVKFPTKIIIEAGNRKLELQTSSISINREVSLKDFTDS